MPIEPTGMSLSVGCDVEIYSLIPLPNVIKFLPTLTVAPLGSVTYFVPALSLLDVTDIEFAVFGCSVTLVAPKLDITLL